MHAVYPGVPAPARVLVADAVVAAFDIVVDRQRAPRQAIAEVIGAVVVPVAAARGRHVNPAAGGLAEIAVAGEHVELHPVALALPRRSEERRVGKGWVSTCRSGGSAYPKKKKTTTKQMR